MRHPRATEQLPQRNHVKHERERHEKRRHQREWREKAAQRWRDEEARRNDGPAGQDHSADDCDP